MLLRFWYHGEIEIMPLLFYHVIFDASADCQYRIVLACCDCPYRIVLPVSEFQISNNTFPLLYQSTPFLCDMIRPNPQKLYPDAVRPVSNFCSISDVQPATSHQTSLFSAIMTAKIKHRTLQMTAFTGLCSLIETVSIGLCSSQQTAPTFRLHF